MNKRKLRKFIVESACQILQGECTTFSNYYKHEGLEIDYKLKGETADIYLIDNGEKELIFTMDFITAAKCWRYPPEVIGPHFNKIIQKYHLEDPNPMIIPMPEENKEGE